MGFIFENKGLEKKVKKFVECCKTKATFCVKKISPKSKVFLVVPTNGKAIKNIRFEEKYGIMVFKDKYRIDVLIGNDAYIIVKDPSKYEVLYIN